MTEFDPKHYARGLLASMRTLSDKFSKPVPVDRLRALCHAVLNEEQEVKRPPLTDVETSVLAAIKGDIAQGIQPTVRSVQARLGYESPNSARVVIDRLIKHGYVKRDGSRNQIVVVSGRN